MVIVVSPSGIWSLDNSWISNLKPCNCDLVCLNKVRVREMVMAMV